MDPGHIDSPPPAEVFPFADGVGGLARADAARPAYDPASGTCSNVYCHGGGARAARDSTPGLARTPAWTGPSSSVVCGGCHGLPPKDGFHAPTLGAADCEGCHFETVGPGFALKLVAADGGVSTHLNGQVDLGGP
jgi:predicted CxxxxCH...CXXCH cytochrome family protein